MSTSQSVYPTLHFRDPRAALAWLRDVLRAEEVLVVGEGDAVAHAEVRVAGGIVMLGGLREDALGRPAGAGALYVAVDDADAVHAHAAAAGAEVLVAPFDTDYGSRDFTLRDPEGNLWHVGTYRP
jgi:uncharacterized glyoxalase superfamily protein PhnB